MFRRRATITLLGLFRSARAILNLHRDPILLDDVPDSISIGSDRSKSKQSQRWVSTIGCRQNRGIELAPARVRKDGGQSCLFFTRGWDWIVRRGFEISVAFTLQKTVQSVQVPNRSLSIQAKW